MAESKTYLNVPYAQKDAAKALGAKWDAAHRKWYVPANKDITLFVQWGPLTNTQESPSAISRRSGSNPSTTKKSPADKIASSGVTTYSTDNDFVAYNGDEPPWN